MMYVNMQAKRHQQKMTEIGDFFDILKKQYREYRKHSIDLPHHVASTMALRDACKVFIENEH